MLSADIFSRWHVNKIKNALKTESHARKGEIRSLLSLMKQKYKLERKVFFWNAIHELFHYWHVIHKPFAIIRNPWDRVVSRYI